MILMTHRCIKVSEYLGLPVAPGRWEGTKGSKTRSSLRQKKSLGSVGGKLPRDSKDKKNDMTA